MPRLAAAPVGVDLAPLEQRALAAAAAQGVGHPPRDVGRPHEHVGERSVFVGEPSPVVEHPRPDPVDHQVAQLLAQISQRLELVAVALFDQPAGRRDQGADAPRGDLDAEAGRHDLFELVRLVEDDDVVLGQHDPPAGQVGPVEVGVDHDDVGRGRPVAAPPRRSTGPPMGS